MSAVRGVENNESSRFIDYTLATPWETLISDIEKALKSLTKSGSKVELVYLGMPFTMEKLKTNTVRNKKDISKSLSIHDPQWLSKSFNARTFIMFSATGPHFADYSVPAKTTVLSAFVTAVKASPFFNIPVFFTYGIITDIGHIKELIGFQMFKKITQDRDIVRFCRYESFLYDKLSPKNELYYFDGLRKIFKKKLAQCGTPLYGEAEQYALNPDHYRITAVNSYLYRVADFKALISENYLSMMMQQAQQSSAAPDVISRVIFSSDFNRLLMSMCAANHTRSLHLSHLLVKLQYREQKQSAVIDNDSYTTFNPSKQPPSSWKVSSYFKIQSNGYGKSGTNGANTTETTVTSASLNLNVAQNVDPLPSTACWMVYCLRRLLVLYIASAFNRRDDLATMDKLAAGGKYTNADLLDRATVDRVIVMLSVESQATLRAVFPAASNGSSDSIPSVSREKSNSNPSPPLTGAEEWLDFELREQIDEIMGFLFETAEHKETRNRANLAATRGALSTSTEDYAPYSMPSFGQGATSPTVSVSSPRKPNLADVLSSALTGGAAIGGATSCTASSCVDEAQSDSVGYFMSLLAVLASCMGGGGINGQSEVYAVSKLWSTVLKETHNSWESGNTLQTFTQPESESAVLGGSFDYTTDNMYNTGRSSSINSSSGASPTVQPTPPRHQYGTYAKYLTSSANQTSVLVGDESRLPICSRDLWQDLIDKKRVRDGLSLSLPDRDESIVVQKLQMLQFCIAMKNESVIYRFRNNMSPTRDSNSGEPRSIISPRLYRRLPLTEDTIAMQERISQKVSSDTSGSGKEHPLLKWQVVRPALISDVNAFKAANSGADLSAFFLWYGVTVPNESPQALLPPSRPVVGIAMEGNVVPTPDDSHDGQVEEMIDESRDNKTDAATNAKLAVIDCSPHDPMTSIGIPLSTMEEIWRTCEGVHCEAQKPLFQAEKEAEKALAFLEKIPFAQLAGTLLSAAMHFVYRILDAKLNQWIVPVSAPVSPVPNGSSKGRTGSGSQSNSSPRGKSHKARGSFSADNLTSSLVSDLALLKEQIASAVQQLKLLSALPLTAVRDEDALSAVVILVDSVAGLVEKLENVCLKADELDMLFKGVVLTPSIAGTKGMNNHISNDLHRMLVALSLRDNYFAERDEEVSILMDFIKIVNVKGSGAAGETSAGMAGSHAWHSYDGRELGLPSSKSYSLRLGGGTSSNFNGGSHKHFPGQFETLSSASRGESLDFARNQSDGAEDTSQTQSSSSSSAAVNEFQMDAVMEQHSLRVSFRIPEKVD